MNHKRITVLRGGPSDEYDVSMQTGANVVRSLNKQFNSVSDIVITKQGDWLQHGIVKSPAQILVSTDVVFLALHGNYGENGEVQKLIQRHNLPFTGSRSLPSAIAFNKALTKRTLRQHGVVMPEDKLITKEDLNNLETVINDIVNKFGDELIIKPLSSGSSVGVQLVRTREDLSKALQQVLPIFKEVMVEEFIRGREATCATLENFRHEDLYVFPVIEIIPPSDQEFFNKEAKYSGKTQEICPGNFSYQERIKLAEITELVHRELGLSQYSRTDFIVRNGQPYFLEVNTLPGLTSESLYPKAAEAVGLTYDQLICHLIETASR